MMVQEDVLKTFKKLKLENKTDKKIDIRPSRPVNETIVFGAGPSKQDYAVDELD